VVQSTPVAITLLVKNPDVKTEKATIHYHDIGDYLDRDQKLKIVKAMTIFPLYYYEEN
jgi:predicted helicase